jgi:hypothetical protein
MAPRKVRCSCAATTQLFHRAGWAPIMFATNPFENLQTWRNRYLIITLSCRRVILMSWRR